MEKENISDDLFSHGESSDPESDVDQIGPISYQHYKDIKSRGRDSTQTYVLQTSDPSSTDEEDVPLTSGGKRVRQKVKGKQPAKRNKTTSATTKTAQAKAKTPKATPKTTKAKPKTSKARPKTTSASTASTTPVISPSGTSNPPAMPMASTTLAPTISPSGTSNPGVVSMASETPPARIPQVQSQGDSLLLQELMKTNQLISTLMEDMQSTICRVAALEDNMASSSSSSRVPQVAKTPRSKDVPLAVRRETRRVYNMLVKDDDDFNGWLIAPGVTFKTAANQTVVNRLVREVKGLNSEFLSQHISDAAYRYYKSTCEQMSVHRRGKQPMKQTFQRRRERLHRKLQVRKAALAKMVFSEEGQRERWKPAFHVDIMSSEDSATEGDEEVIMVKTLPWRSDQVNQMMKRLDDKIHSEKSAQAKRQAKRRVASLSASSRSKPESRNFPAWLFRD